MTKCTGCNRVAERYATHNEEIALCIPCTNLLWGIKTRPLADWGAPKCYGCDSTVYHGARICVFCQLDFIHGLAATCGFEALDDNPILYELLLPHIRFIQSLEMLEPSCGETFYRFWLRGDDWHTIDFSRLANDFEYSP